MPLTECSPYDKAVNRFNFIGILDENNTATIKYTGTYIWTEIMPDDGGGFSDWECIKIEGNMEVIKE